MKKTLILLPPLLLLLALPWACSSSPPTVPATPTPTPTGPPSFTYDISFGTTGSAPMTTPNGIAVSGNNLWVADEYIFGFIQEWTLSGSVSQTFTSYNGTSYNFPRDMAAGPDGYLYEADGSHVVVELTAAGAYVTVFGTTELGSDDVDAVAVGATKAYLLDDSGPKVLGYSLSGTGAAKTFSASITFGGTVLGSYPRGIALDGAGNVLVADSSNDRVLVFNSAGVTQSAVTLLSAGVPTAVTVDGAGYLYVADNHNHEVQLFGPTGAAVSQFGSAHLAAADGIALDGSGNLYVADGVSNQVVRFNKN